VTNKYYPPDFDPSIIPKRDNWRAPGKQIKIRFMLPMSIQCQTCGEYMYRGKKFNARKEDCYGPDGDYLGIRIYRFYIRCMTCCAEVCMRTDPKNSDYVVERGASRNFEPWKQESELNKKIAEIRKEVDDADAMANLESRTKESKKEMEILDALQEIQDLNNRAANVNTAQILEIRAREKQEAEEKAIKDEVQKIDFKSKGGYVKRIESGSSDSEARRIKRAKNSVFAKKPSEDATSSGKLADESKTAEETNAADNMPAPAAVEVITKKKKKKKKKKGKKGKKRKRDDGDDDDEEEEAPSGLGLVAYGSSDSGH